MLPQIRRLNDNQTNTDIEGINRNKLRGLA